MVVCINTSGFIYAFIAAMANNVTGSLFLATLLIFIFIMAIAAGLFRIPIEFTAIILLPMNLAFLACIGSDWTAIVGTILIYLGILLGKNFFFR